MRQRRAATDSEGVLSLSTAHWGSPDNLIHFALNLPPSLNAMFFTTTNKLPVVFHITKIKLKISLVIKCRFFTHGFFSMKRQANDVKI